MAGALTHGEKVDQISQVHESFQNEHSHDHMDFEDNMTVFNCMIAIFVAWIVLLFLIAFKIPFRCFIPDNNDDNAVKTECNENDDNETKKQTTAAALKVYFE